MPPPRQSARGARRPHVCIGRILVEATGRRCGIGPSRSSEYRASGYEVIARLTISTAAISIFQRSRPITATMLAQAARKCFNNRAISLLVFAYLRTARPRCSISATRRAYGKPRQMLLFRFIYACRSRGALIAGGVIFSLLLSLLVWLRLLHQDDRFVLATAGISLDVLFDD